MKKFAIVWLAIAALSASMIACGKKKNNNSNNDYNPLTVSCASCTASAALLTKTTSRNNSLSLQLNIYGDLRTLPPSGISYTDAEPLRWYGNNGAAPVFATGILQINGGSSGYSGAYGNSYGSNNTCGALNGLYTVRPVSAGSINQRMISGLVLEAISQVDSRRLTLRLENVILTTSGGGLAGTNTNNILAGAMDYSSGGLVIETVYGQGCNSQMPIY